MGIDFNDIDDEEDKKKKEEEEKNEPKNHYRDKKTRDEEADFTWKVLSGIGCVVMALVCLDLWFIVKENPDKITPYYLQ